MKELSKSPNNEQKAKVIKAKHEGTLQLAQDGEPINVAVLENGTRLIGRNEIFRAFGRTKRGRAINETRAENLPSFIDAKNLQQYISPELFDMLTNPIKCKTLAGPVIDGYKAEVLPLLCDAYLDADKSNSLTASQKPLAQMSLMIVRSLSKIGIIALIDEATGYQHEREKDELQKILKAYIAEELLVWQKTFPDVFYRELFRLNGWDYTVNGIKKRPGVIGSWTNTLVYKQLPKGVLEELKSKTPKSASGNYTARLFQRLTPDTGNPHLTAQIQQIVTMFQLSDSMEHMWQQFEKLKERQTGVVQQEIPFQFDKKGHTIEPAIEEEQLSNFNKKLSTALDYNPKKKEDKKGKSLDQPNLFE